MSKYANIRIRPETKNAADKLATKFNLNLLDFYSAMVKYFEKTGVNPNDLVVLSPAEELKKFRDTIIGFMRKQEKEFILPVFTQLNTLAVQLSDYIENEAPKNDDKKSVSSVPKIGDKTKVVEKNKTAQDESTEHKIPKLDIEATQNEAYKKLKIEHDALKTKYENVYGYYVKILENTTYKSTGFNSANVIELPKGEIENFRNYLKVIQNVR